MGWDICQYSGSHVLDDGLRFLTRGPCVLTYSRVIPASYPIATSDSIPAGNASI